MSVPKNLEDAPAQVYGKIHSLALSALRFFVKYFPNYLSLLYETLFLRMIFEKFIYPNKKFVSV